MLPHVRAVSTNARKVNVVCIIGLNLDLAQLIAKILITAFSEHRVVMLQ